MTARPAAQWIDPEAELYTAGEVATLFKVDPKTVARWAQAGRFPEDAVIRTLGGHRRYRGKYIRSLLAGAS